MFRRFAPVVLALGVTGCSSMPFEFVEQDRAPAQTSLGNSIPPSMSMAALPVAAGHVISVIERQRGNALQHEVTLHGAPPNYGENQIIVSAFRNASGSGDKAVPDTIPSRPPTSEDIQQEMEERIIGGALPVSSNLPRNMAGTFGYAFGKRNSVSCLYAWQWVESENKLAGSPTSVRVRLCKPNATEEVLVDHVRQLYLVPRNRPSQSQQLIARGPYGGDALSAARGTGYAAYQPHPYGMGYAAAPAPAAALPAAPARKVASASVHKRVLVRRIVKRRVVAPQIYSYAPPVPMPAGAAVPVPVQVAPVITAVPKVRVPAQPSGYSAVPMPQ